MRFLKSRVLALAIVVMATASLPGCSPEESLLGSSDEPAVYVILSRDKASYSPTGVPVTDSAMYALVVSLGSPLRSRYRDVELFTMRRVLDGAELAWVEFPRSGDVRPRGGTIMQVDVGNWILSETRVGSRLGRDSLTDGTHYELEVMTEGRSIAGSAVLPGTPSIEFVESAEGTVAHWPSATGAAAYWVVADTDGAATLTLDTLYVLKRNLPPGPQPPGPPYIRVIAIDANLHAMLTDTLLYRSGVQGGYGVFGATSSARRVIPNPP